MTFTLALPRRIANEQNSDVVFFFFDLKESKFELHLVLTQQMDLFPDPLNVFQVSV